MLQYADERSELSFWHNFFICASGEGGPILVKKLLDVFESSIRAKPHNFMCGVVSFYPSLNTIMKFFNSILNLLGGGKMSRFFDV